MANLDFDTTQNQQQSTRQPGAPPTPRYLQQDGSYGAEIPKSSVPDNWVSNKAGTAWVSPDHPDAWQGGAGSASAPGVSNTPNAGGLSTQPYGTGVASTPQANVQQQATNAQTYSQAPGAAPTNATTNQGTQDVVRNSLLQRATQGTTVDRNDPNFRQQSDAYAAGVERARRNELADQAEAFSTAGLDGGLRSAQATEGRLVNERAAQAQGSFEAQLVGRELENRRAEILDALNGLRGQLTIDQQMQLQRDLAELSAQIQRLGITTSTDLGRAELALKEKLGMGGLNLDAQRTLLQNQQVNNRLGFDIGDREAYYNYLALQSIL